MGGNVFKNAEPFDHSKVELIQRAIFPVLDKLRVAAFPIGSTANPTPGRISGDYDIIVDQRPLATRFNENNPRKIRQLLRDAFIDCGFQATLNGIAVHVLVPDNGHFYQVDIMVVEYARQVSKFHLHKIPAGSPYKGVNKHLAMMYLAKKQGLLWSAFQGLYNRTPDGKRGELITNDVDRVSYVLLGAKSTSDSLDCLETMLEALPDEEAKEMMEALAEDPSWKEFGHEIA